MVDQLVIKNASEPSFVNHNMVENLVLQNRLIAINPDLAMITIAALIVKLDLGAHGATAVRPVEKDLSQDEDKLSFLSMVLAWIVLNFMKLISVPTSLTALLNVSMAKIFIQNALLLAVLLIMIITVKLHVYHQEVMWNSAHQR